MIQRLCLLALLLPLVAPKAAAQIAVTSSSVMERTVTPGEQYQGRILVMNTTDDFQEAKVYQTDYLSFASKTVTFTIAAGV